MGTRFFYLAANLFEFMKCGTRSCSLKSAEEAHKITTIPEEVEPDERLDGLLTCARGTGIRRVTGKRGNGPAWPASEYRVGTRSDVEWSNA